MSETIERTKTRRRTDTQTMLQLSGVGVRYRLLTEKGRTLKGRVLSAFSAKERADAEFWALRNIDLSVERGQVLGIVGPNGSGKSTLLRVISRIIEPAEGRIMTIGRVTPVLDLSSTLNPEYSGRENAFIFGALHGVPRERVAEYGFRELSSLQNSGRFLTYR